MYYVDPKSWVRTLGLVTNGCLFIFFSLVGSFDNYSYQHPYVRPRNPPNQQNPFWHYMFLFCCCDRQSNQYQTIEISSTRWQSCSCVCTSSKYWQHIKNDDSRRQLLNIGNPQFGRGINAMRNNQLDNGHSTSRPTQRAPADQET